MLNNTVLTRITAAIALASAFSGCASAQAGAAASPHDPSARVATANFSSCAKPIWPEGALAAQRTGTVALQFDVDAEGKVIGSRVANSSGHADLDEAARAGISKCTFNPGMQNGMPVRSTMQMRYVWTLK